MSEDVAEKERHLSIKLSYMLANFIKRAKKWGDEVENWLSIFSCRDDAQLSFRPTTTDNDPINLGSKKNSGWALQVAARNQGRASRSFEQVKVLGFGPYTNDHLYEYFIGPIGPSHGGQPRDQRNLRRENFCKKQKRRRISSVQIWSSEHRSLNHFAQEQSHGQQTERNCNSYGGLSLRLKRAA